MRIIVDSDNRDQHLYDILFEKKRQASELIKMNRKLIRQVEYKQLNPSVDRARLPWILNK